jgi:flavin-dependent dehydrogenase
VADCFDYAVVGGGPAGLSVAIFAALAGRSAVVLERHEGPIDKACGEGVMPPGVSWLKRMGIEFSEAVACPFRGIRWVDEEISTAADFVEGPGLGIRRTVLSEALLARAAALGVDVRHAHVGLFEDAGDHVFVDSSRGRLVAQWLVAADGLHSHVRQAAGFTTRPGVRRRFGMRRHFQLPPWSDHVEVHWADGVEAYVTPVGPEQVGIAFLWSPRAGLGEYEAFLSRFPALRSRLGTAATAPATSLLGSGPFEMNVTSVVHGRVLLVGDASGYVDAITGEGLSLAFASAAALVDATCAGKPSAYAAAWATLRRRHVTMTRLALWLSEHPSVRRQVMRALRDNPQSFQACLALNTGAWGWGRALPRLAKVAISI